MNLFGGLKSGKSSIFRKLFLPIMGASCIQIVIFSIIILGVVIPETTNNATKILDERVINRKQYLEMDLIQRWTNMDEHVNRIIQLVGETLNENGKSVSDISDDAILNQQVIDKIAPQILYLLRRNYTTGAFIVLDGPSLTEKDHIFTRPGFYIRDLDPSGYSEGNSDILVERGLPFLSKRFGIPLDSFWESNFEFPSAGRDPDEWFYFKSLDAAQLSSNRDYKNFGYWSTMFQVKGDATKVITYSVPLIYPDGTVFGVLGIDITEQHLRKYLPYEEIGNNQEGIYILARTNKERTSFEPLCISARASAARFSHIVKFFGEPLPQNNLYRIKGFGKDYYGSIQAFKLYNHNTPFEDEVLTLVGMQDKDDLFSFADRIRAIILFTVILSVVIGIICVYAVGYIVINPITRVVSELEKIDPHSRVNLQKTHIKEIDQLTNSIENMSIAVAESASKISKIIEMAQTPIGVFEYEEAGNRVFCSSKLVSILGWDESKYVDSHYDRDVFFKNLTSMEKFWYENTGNATIYKIPQEKGNKWIQITLLKEDHGTLGTVADISREMEEKIRIEFERDYDLLTGIFNRRAFSVALDNLFKFPARLGVGAFVMFDLDNLKYVNDTYGHEYGDEYIVAMANVLKDFKDFNGIVSRRSGDEFNVFLYGYRSKAKVKEIIYGMYKKITGQSIMLPNDNEYSLRTSAGIAYYPDDATDVKNLTVYSDFAMYSVKHSIKGNIQEFNLQDFKTRSYLVTGHEALSRLLEKGELVYALQPILDVSRGTVYGYEMLMRSKIKELATPVDILAMARSQSKMYQLERTTWFNAVKTFTDKVKAGQIEKGTKVFFNSIGSLILQEDDMNNFISEYKEYLPSIVLELIETEQCIIEFSGVKTKMIKDFGGMIAIDDFGSGYNNEAILAISSPDLIKVDNSIIRKIDKDQGKQQLLRNIISYARSRNIMIVAEGVETKGEMEIAVTFGIDFLQGYYIGEPRMDVAQIDERVVQEMEEIRDRKSKE